MSFSVRNNLNAMGTTRYIKLNDGRYNQAVGRLSSGVRINRAVDDPSGLIVSERFRSQVDSLNQTIRNAQDVVSLSKTAEGALDEVTSVLRSMRSLALHAANVGVNDSTVVQADQEQIDKAVETLNQIANTTSFGARKLLNGNSGVTGSCSNSNLSFVSGGSNTVSGTYNVNVTTAATKGIMESVNQRVVVTDVIQIDGTGVVDPATDLDAQGTITVSGEVFDNKSFTVNVTDGMSLNSILQDFNVQFEQAGMGDIDAVFNGIGLGFTFNNRLGDAIGGVNSTFFSIDIINSGIGNLEEQLGSTEDNYGLGSAASSATSKLAQAETLTFKNGADGEVKVNLTAGMTVTQAVTQINSVLQSANFKVTASWDTVDRAFKLTNTEGGSREAVKYTVSSNRSTRSSLGFAITPGTDYYIADGGSFSGFGTTKTNGIDIVGTIGGVSCTGFGQYLTGADGSAADGVKVRYTGTSTGNVGSVSVQNNSLNFAINESRGQNLKFNFGDLRASGLGIEAAGLATMTSASVASINLLSGSNGAGAQDAIKIIDSALSQVSRVRASIGSFQKDVIESSIRSMGVAVQNIASSESAIRDADMAGEMLSYSKTQIIQNTSMAMLAQANQNPQIIVKLLQNEI